MKACRIKARKPFFKPEETIYKTLVISFPKDDANCH